MPVVEAIKVENLEKTYPGARTRAEHGAGGSSTPEVKAVQGVSFHVNAGEIFGFLGPNGAGKTTTVSVLTTLLLPTRGRCLVSGIDVAREPERVRREIGLVFQDTTADGELTGRENMELVAGLFGMSQSEVQPRIKELLTSMDLTEAADRRVKGYSGGMKRRLELAVALVHTPQVLFLDEPTIGLDPQGRAGFWRYIQEMRKKEQVTILMTTHYLDEVENLCDRIAIIDHGKIIATGTNDELKERVGGDEVEVRVENDEPNLTPDLSALPGVTGVRKEPGLYQVKCPRGEGLVAPVVTTCDRRGVAVAGVKVLRPSLDRVFLELTGKAYREEGYDDGRASSNSAFRPRRGGDSW